MHLMGSKALVVRAEIYPRKLEPLLQSLSALSISVKPATVPPAEDLEPDVEYSLSLQLLSTAGDSDRRVEVPHVPG